MIKKTYTSKLINKDNLTYNVICLTVSKPKKFVYLAGQFVQFYIPDSANAKKENLRSYSIASAPNDKDLKFCIKLVPNGKSGEYLKKIKIGESIKFGDPLGRFTNINSKSSLYFIATGAGIAPIMSIIRNELIDKKNIQPMHLLFGVRSENDIFWTEILDNLKEKYKNFDYKLTLSQSSPEWKGLKGRVTDHLLKKISAKGAVPVYGMGPASGWEKNSHYFICGKMAMIDDVNGLLKTRGAAKTNIHFEAF